MQNKFTKALIVISICLLQPALVSAAPTERQRPRPVDIASGFNLKTCNFSNRVRPYLNRAGEIARQKHGALAKGGPASAEAEVSAYLAVNFSLYGLHVKGVGVHYESSSLVFLENPQQVMAAFRSRGYRIDNNGNFAYREVNDPASASIRGTGPEAGQFGQAILYCGI